MAWICGCRALGVEYHVRVEDAQRGRVQITIDIDGVDRNALILKAYESNKFLKISDLTAVTPSGRALEIQSDVMELGDHRFPHSVTQRKVILGSHRGRVTLHYMATLGARIRLSGEGRRPRQASGYMDSTVALFAGRNLFLVPDGEVDEFRVRFEVPDDWEIAAPWQSRLVGESKAAAGQAWAMAYLPRVYRFDSEEDLVNSAVGLGHLRQRQLAIGRDTLRVHTYAKWDDAFQDSLVSNSAQLYSYMCSLFGTGLEDPYSVIFTPKTDDGLDILTAASSASQGMEMSPATLSRWISCAQNMAY